MNTVGRTALRRMQPVDGVGGWWQLARRTAVSKPSKMKGGEPVINYEERVVNIVPGVNEPTYLRYLKPQVPYYELLDVRMRGYDHATLEQYADFVADATRKLGVQLVARWHTPNSSFRYDSLKHESHVVDQSNVVHVYERNVQLKNLPAHLAVVYLRLVQQCKPVGVTLSVYPHRDEHDEIRYIPDSQLNALKAELLEWQQPLSVIAEKKRI